MQVSLTFNFDNAAEAADFLAQANGAEPARDERPPWEDDDTVSGSTASADPWADEATDTKPATSQRSSQSHTHPDAGKLFPASGTYPKAVPNDASRSWQFGVDGAPDCDCGYPAALVTGRKGKREWSAYWCPIGFTKDWKNKCGFSEFA
jgi:hypothetical protein